MGRRKIKPDISQENLKSHRIFYHEDVYRRPYIFPEHVDAVREILLSFEDTIPAGNGWTTTLKEEVEKFGADGVGPEALDFSESLYVPIEGYERELNERSPQWRAAHENLKLCKDIARKARGLHSDSEDGWANFWRKDTFTVVSERAKYLPALHPVLDSWSLEGDFEWTEFDILEPNNSNLTPRSHPKPDLTYAFPVTNKSPENLRGAERDEFSQSFSIQALQRLQKKKTICTMTTKLRKWTSSPGRHILRTMDLACFPWAVIEFKRQDLNKRVSAAEVCYCQAANASAAALALRGQLFDKTMKEAYSSLPPIVSFTCVGPNVRVWLTYYTEPDTNGERTRQMVCIWSTSVRLTLGVAGLHTIIMNMHTWAARLLKPRIQACAFQILQTPDPLPVREPSPPMEEFTNPTLFSTPRNEVSSPQNFSIFSPSSPTLVNMFEISSVDTATASPATKSPLPFNLLPSSKPLFPIVRSSNSTPVSRGQSPAVRSSQPACSSPLRKQGKLRTPTKQRCRTALERDPTRQDDIDDLTKSFQSTQLADSVPLEAVIAATPRASTSDSQITNGTRRSSSFPASRVFPLTPGPNTVHDVDGSDNLSHQRHASKNSPGDESSRVAGPSERPKFDITGRISNSSFGFNAMSRDQDYETGWTGFCGITLKGTSQISSKMLVNPFRTSEQQDFRDPFRQSLPMELPRQASSSPEPSRNSRASRRSNESESPQPLATPVLESSKLSEAGSASELVDHSFDFPLRRDKQSCRRVSGVSPWTARGEAQSSAHSAFREQPSVTSRQASPSDRGSEFQPGTITDSEGGFGQESDANGMSEADITDSDGDERSESSEDFRPTPRGQNRIPPEMRSFIVSCSEDEYWGDLPFELGRRYRQR